MKLLLKLNLVIAVIFVIGLAITYRIADRLLQNNARSEIQGNARIMMESALAVRAYTIKHIKPLLDTQMRYKFLPETVPSFSATEYFNNLRSKFPDYSYKEATLNPTNPRDRAVDWEVDVVNHFREDPEAKELIGERDSAVGRILYLARPLQIADPACLSCHSSVAAAPQTLLDTYGSANGFGWQLRDVIGAQIVSVPYDLPMQRANAALRSFLYLFVGLFFFLFIAANVLMITLVLRPIQKLSAIANEVSLGHLDAPKLTVRGNDEIAALGQSFNRLRITVEKALEALSPP